MHDRPASKSAAEGVSRISKPTSAQAVRRSKSVEVLSTRRSLASEPNGHHHLTSSESDAKYNPDLKRKRPHDAEGPAFAEPPRKKGGLGRATTPIDRPEALLNGAPCDPVAYWATHDTWPLNFAEKGREMSNPALKRLRSQSTSWAQGVRDGKNPPAHTRAHEIVMQEAGFDMDELQEQAIIDEESRGLCELIQTKEYALPQGSLFEDGKFRKVLRRVQVRNEARIFRDITPLLVPSAELLDFDNQPNLKDIAEEVQAEWTKCATLCGPKPKPDFVAGVSASAFTTDEKRKLEANHSRDCPNIFAESVYYPFLICEVKCYDGKVRAAERQTMHSASIAVNAVIQLYKKISRTHEVNQKILAFSVSHDSRTVKISGHFALIKDEKTTFFRYPLYQDNFALSDRWRSYKIIRAVYEHFFPEHLKRIQTALSELPSPEPETPTTGEWVVDSNLDGVSSEMAAAAVPARIPVFKKPSLPSTSQIQQQNDRLVVLLQEQQKEQREQKEMMERQLAQQKEEQREQKEMMERELASLREVIDLLKQTKT